jgi:hypothetical protein
VRRSGPNVDNHFNIATSDLVDEKVEKLFSGTGLKNIRNEEMKWLSNEKVIQQK